MPPTPPPTDSAAQLATEVRRLSTIIERLEVRQSFFVRPGHYLLFSFLNGLFIFLGSTVGVALFLWLLNILGYLPGLGEAAGLIKSVINR